MVQQADLDRALTLATAAGYVYAAEPMSFAGDRVQIHRVSKPDPELRDLLSLDLLTLGPELATVWEGRERRALRAGTLTVLSREGLITLEQLRGSARDEEDIRQLRALDAADG